MGQKILAKLENLAYRLQRKYMEPKMTTELVSPFFAFFHPEDKSQNILSLYQVKFAGQLGKTVVLVTGCFDILHQEHFNFLKKAKKRGDVLIVGLEPDSRIKKMKGGERPISPWSKRAQNLLRINEVDFVIKLPDNFDRRAVRKAILQVVKPKILAISGQDHLEGQKRKECHQIGCQVKIVHPYNPKISTTKILVLDKKA